MGQQLHHSINLMRQASGHGSVVRYEDMAV